MELEKVGIPMDSCHFFQVCKWEDKFSFKCVVKTSEKNNGALF